MGKSRSQGRMADGDVVRRAVVVGCKRDSWRQGVLRKTQLRHREWQRAQLSGDWDSGDWLRLFDVQSGGIVVPLLPNPVSVRVSHWPATARDLQSAPPTAQRPAKLTAAAAAHCSASLFLSVGSPGAEHGWCWLPALSRPSSDRHVPSSNQRTPSLPFSPSLAP